MGQRIPPHINPAPEGRCRGILTSLVSGSLVFGSRVNLDRRGGTGRDESRRGENRDELQKGKLSVRLAPASRLSRDNSRASWRGPRVARGTLLEKSSRHHCFH